MTTTITINKTPHEPVFGTPVLGECSATINGTAATPEAVSIVGGKLTLAFVQAAPAGATVTVGYSNATNAVVSSTGTPMAPFSARPSTGAPLPPPSSWTLDEDFSGLALDAALINRAEWTSLLTNGIGQIQGTGAGTIKTPRLSGSSNFPGEAVRYEVNIGTEQEVEIDVVTQGVGTAFVQFGTVLRASAGNATCYRATLSPTEGFRVQKGSGWDVANLSAPIAWTPPARPYTANFRALTVGGTCVIECRVGGALVGSMTDNTPLTGVRIGLSALTGGSTGTSGPDTITAIRARAFA